MLRVAQKSSTMARSSQNLMIEAFLGKAQVDEHTLMKLTFNKWLKFHQTSQLKH